MKTFGFYVVLMFGIIGSDLLAEPRIIPSATASLRDGFTRGSTGVLFTQDNKTVTLERSMMLTNGLLVDPDGSVRLPSGERAVLNTNQLLTPEGTFETVALNPDGVAPVTSVVSPAQK